MYLEEFFRCSPSNIKKSIIQIKSVLYEKFFIAILLFSL